MTASTLLDQKHRSLRELIDDDMETIARLAKSPAAREAAIEAGRRLAHNDDLMLYVARAERAAHPRRDRCDKDSAAIESLIDSLKDCDDQALRDDLIMILGTIATASLAVAYANKDPAEKFHFRYGDVFFENAADALRAMAIDFIRTTPTPGIFRNPDFCRDLAAEMLNGWECNVGHRRVYVPTVSELAQAIATITPEDLR